MPLPLSEAQLRHMERGGVADTAKLIECALAAYAYKAALDEFARQVVEVLATADTWNFRVGDQVHKTRGYRFVGKIMSRWRGDFDGGREHYAVENADGLCHIFLADQLLPS